MPALFRRPIIVLFVLMFACAARAELPADLPPATLKAYEAFKAKDQNPVYGDPTVVANLAAAVEGDLCFLEYAAAHSGDHNYRFLACREQLGKLNTDRTYDRLIAMLDAKKSSVRTVAIDLLAGWHRPEAVEKLLPHLSAPDGWERSATVYALANYQDPRIEPELFKWIDDEQAGPHVRSVLARRQYGPAFDKCVAVLKTAPPGERDSAIADVAAFRRPQSVDLLLAELRSFDGNPEKEFLRSWTRTRLSECLAAATPVLGNVPNDSTEQWALYWERAKPLLDEHLQLRNPPKPAAPSTIYTDDQFTMLADDVTLIASLDQPTFRTGDPMRIRLELKNGGKKPVKVVPPHIPSGWYPTMAYGVHLVRDGKVLLDLPPTDFYIGSYSGPPQFKPLGPGESFTGETSLQHWLSWELDLPLIEGDYEMQIVFDPAKYAGMAAKNPELLHRWEAAPIKFTIKGPPRQDAQELLGVIAAAAGDPFLVAHLTSKNTDDREAAWRTVFIYGDSRLGPFVTQFVHDHPDQAPPYRAAKDLRPYEHKSRSMQR